MRTVMVTTEPPAVARRRLRIAIRRAREARALTQGQVAEALEWSLSKVNRIEAGDVTVSNTDLQALLHLLGVTEPGQAERMLADARAARRRGWWDEARYREYLTPATMQLLQFESEASAIRSFQTTLVPGLLQTGRYAETVINNWALDMPPEGRETRLEVRMRRRAQVFERPEAPRYLQILDESVLLRDVGGPAVMTEQLQEILTMIHNATIELRVLPLTDAVVMALVGPFTIFDLGEEENAVLYREYMGEDEITHKVDRVANYRAKFERMWKMCRSAEDSARMIKARLAEAAADHPDIPG